MKRSRKIWLGSGILAVLALSALFLTGGGKEVETVQVRQGDITRRVVDTGYVQPSTDYSLYAAQTARVARVPVKTGQAVKQGQILVVLENMDLSVQINDTRSQLSQAAAAVPGARASLERSQLELQEARDNLNRVQELYRAGGVARVEYDKARLQVEAREKSVSEQASRLDSSLAQVAGLSQSLQQLTAKEDQLVVKSPVEGTVIGLPARQEQVVVPGALLATVASAGRLEVKADILSDDLAEVREGQKVLVTAPVLGSKVLAGEVAQIYPRAEEKQSALGITQRRVPVIITLADPAQLKPGYEVKVAIETVSRQNVLTLPREAVTTTGDGQKKVMAVVNGRVQHRQVQTGISDGEKIEVTGLEAGSLVIKDGSLNLAEKTEIKTDRSTP